MAGCNHAQRPGLAFWVFAAGALLSGVLCAWLPEPESLARLRAPADEVLV